MTSRLFNVVRESRRHSSHPKFGNESPAFRHALAWCKHSSPHCILSDKDVGFALVKDSDMRDLFQSKLSPAYYCKIDKDDLDTNGIIKELDGWARPYVLTSRKVRRRSAKRQSTSVKCCKGQNLQDL